ncbi:MAG: ABC transporter ATP-binding protein, partial [Myxococcaceae bacterium]
MASVMFKQVTKRFGQVSVIEGLDLEVRDHEFMVLVGPSGCGKSTALRMIAGLEDITGGTISIGDRVVNEIPPKDRDVAMVFQSYALYPHMTVRENLEFGLRIRKTPRAEIDRLVPEAAHILGIQELMERKPKELSGGQRQRVALGRAIVRKPSVFLFDEPLSNLDAKLRVEVRAEIKKLQARLQTTTVYVTHDQVEAMTLGDRVVVLRDGVVQQSDHPQVLYERPANLFVATFIGSPAMNVVEGRLELENGAVECRIGS